MAAQWPLLTDRLVDLLTELWTDVTVTYGPTTAKVLPPRRAYVAWSGDGDDVGDYTQEWDDNGWQLKETGEVPCLVTVETGDSDLDTRRDAVFTLANLFETHLRSNRLLGVLPAGSDVSLTVKPRSALNSRGSAQTLLLTVNYTTRT